MPPCTPICNPLQRSAGPPLHDSVLCRATDMACLSAIVRETYMHLFAEHDYLTDWAKQIGATTPPPIVGDLEPEGVIESTYFSANMATIYKTEGLFVLRFQAIFKPSEGTTLHPGLCH